MADENPYSPPQPPPPSDAAFTEQLEAPQSVTVELLEADYIAFADRLNSTNATVRKWINQRRVFYLAASGLLLFLSVGAEESGFPLRATPTAFGVMAIVFGVLGVFQPQWARWTARRRVRRLARSGLYGRLDTAVMVTLLSDGFRLEDDHGHLFRRWWAGLSVVATPTHLFLHTEPASAVIVPARSFQSEAAFRGFCDLARRLAGAAASPGG